jgi:TonB-dependent SusC/RagA subfamily outer membrane receptor
MKTKLQLILTNPCTKDWDDLPEAGPGRYCDSCEKHIVDLSDKSDAELIRFFQKKKENVCGRLLSGQLNRELVQPIQKANWAWLLPLAVGAIFTTPAKATELRPLTHVIDDSQKPYNPINEDTTTAIKADTVGGHIIDQSTGKPLAGVKVKQRGFQNVLAVSDSAGRFELAQAKDMLSSSYTFELPNYSSLDWKITDGMEVKMIDARRVRIGGVSVSGITPGPLYVLTSGKKTWTVDQFNLQELPQDWIEQIEILKDAQATALYGAKGANGVILIKVNKAYAKKMKLLMRK